MKWKFWQKDATEQPGESILTEEEQAYIKACKAEGRKDTLRAVGKGLLIGAAIGAAAGCAYAYAQSRESSGGSTEPTSPTPEQQEDLLAEMPADMMDDLGV
jgi:hypothetical protein